MICTPQSLHWLILGFVLVDHPDRIVVMQIDFAAAGVPKIFGEACFRADDDLECCADVLLALDVYLPAHLLNQQLTYAQTKSCPLRINLLMLTQFHKVHENIR